MYLKLTVHDYKGGELGTPEINKSLETLLTYVDDLDYKIEPKEGNLSILNNEQILDNFWKWLEEDLANLYAGKEGFATQFHVIKEDNITQLHIKDLKTRCNAELLLKLIKDEK